jgi:hypothetical protein
LVEEVGKRCLSGLSRRREKRGGIGPEKISRFFLERSLRSINFVVPKRKKLFFEILK